MKSKVRGKIDGIIDALTDTAKIKKIVLFGSLIKNNKEKGFDIDLYLEESEPMHKREKRRIKELVNNVAGIYMVDLVFSSEISEELKKVIEKEGKVLYEKG